MIVLFIIFLIVGHLLSVKYRKSKSQREKEKQRRERVFQILTGVEWLTECEIAERLGVSRSTVQRDKRKLKRRLKRFLDKEKRELYSELSKMFGEMSLTQRDEALGFLLGTRRAKGKPRGKPFTSEYQPRWKMRK